MKRIDMQILYLYYKLRDKISAARCLCYLYLLKMNTNVQFTNLRLQGIPIIDTRNGGFISLQENILLNSRNTGYHMNLHSPVKLLADKPGAFIKIGKNTRIHGSCIHAQGIIMIGKNCLIGGNCQIIDASGHSLSFDDVDNRINTTGTVKSIKIDDSVWIGANSIILPGAHIGRGSVIGAGSIVTGTIPSMALAAGNPAKVIRNYKLAQSLHDEPC